MLNNLFIFIPLFLPSGGPPLFFPDGEIIFAPGKDETPRGFCKKKIALFCLKVNSFENF